MVAKTTGQGTAASETALCSKHDNPRERRNFADAADPDVTGPWVNVGDNPALRCVVCGITAERDNAR